TLIKGGTLIDCTGASPRANSAILIEDERITSLDAPLNTAADKTIDASGMWIMPGLINMHDHLAMRDLVGHPMERLSKGSAKIAVNCVRNALTALQRGWTTVRDMTAPDGMALAFRDLIAQGDIPGPRVVSCG